MEDIVSKTKADYVRAKDRIIQILTTTPDDKLNWAPSPTARTPIQLVAHSADAVGNILTLLQGRGSIDFTDIPKLDARLRASDREYTTKEQVLALLDTNSAAFLAFLDALTPEKLSSTMMGAWEAPMTVAIGFPADHMRGHIAQMEYVQTIWGDHDWYM